MWQDVALLYADARTNTALVDNRKMSLRHPVSAPTMKVIVNCRIKPTDSTIRLDPNSAARQGLYAAGNNLCATTDVRVGGMSIYLVRIPPRSRSVGGSNAPIVESGVPLVQLRVKKLRTYDAATCATVVQ